MQDLENEDFLFFGGVDDAFLLAAEQTVQAQLSPPPKHPEINPEAHASPLLHSQSYFPEPDGDDEYGTDIDLSELSPFLSDDIPNLEEERDLLDNPSVGDDDHEFATADHLPLFPTTLNSSQELPDPADHQAIELTSSSVVPPDISSSQTLSHWGGRDIHTPDTSPANISPKRPKPGDSSSKKRQKVINAPHRPNSLSRPPLPAIVLENSLVHGLTPKHYIRSCFCIASAIQLAERGDAGVNNDGLIELYARVSFSSRTPPTQYFQFIDLRHEDPPYLNGSSEIYKRCDLWDEDASNFLDFGARRKFAKVVGKMRKVRGWEGSTPWHLEVYGIQVITWEDVSQLKVAVTGRVDQELYG